MDCCNNKEGTKVTIRNDEEKANIKKRLAKIEGQVRGISKMIDEDRYCDDVLIQLSAVDSSIKSLANLILQRHLHTCIVESIKSGNEDVLDEIVELFKRFQ